MLIISQNEFLKEIANSKQSNSMDISDRAKSSNSLPISDAVILENTTYDSFRKPPNIPNIPHEIKAIVGALGSVENHEEVAKTFGISKQTVGILSRDDHSNELVKEQKSNILESIKTKTATKIDQCIEFIEVLKTNNKELLNTAESLSRIHKNISPTAEINTGAQFVFYVPDRQNKLEDYEIIENNL